MVQELKLVFNGDAVYFLYLHNKEKKTNKLIATIYMEKTWSNPVIYLYLIPKLYYKICLENKVWYEDDQQDLEEVIHEREGGE
ncbi:MAG: hypothetical protein QXH67_06245 [Candidatus Bathyarchaeia archaeon]